jgi:hypothetical protein
MKYRVKITRLPQARTGYQVQGGLANDIATIGGGDFNSYNGKKQLQARQTMGAVPRDEANLEAEGGETLVGDLDGSTMPSFFGIKGPRHSAGGVPMNLPDDTFIFSDTKAMKINDPKILKMFGKSVKKGGGYTPAELSKVYDVNKYRKILQDPESNKMEIKTAEMMIKNYVMKLGALAIAQESKKSFPQGIPVIAKPYMEANGITEEDLMPELAKQRKEEEAMQQQMMAQQQQQQAPQQGMPQEGMQQEAPPMQMPDGQPIAQPSMEQGMAEAQQMPPEQMQQAPMARYGMVMGGFGMPLILENGGSSFYNRQNPMDNRSSKLNMFTDNDLYTAKNGGNLYKFDGEGNSQVNADGTPKTKEQLETELRNKDKPVTVTKTKKLPDGTIEITRSDGTKVYAKGNSAGDIIYQKDPEKGKKGTGTVDPEQYKIDICDKIKKGGYTAEQAAGAGWIHSSQIANFKNCENLKKTGEDKSEFYELEQDCPCKDDKGVEIPGVFATKDDAGNCLPETCYEEVQKCYCIDPETGQEVEVQLTDGKCDCESQGLEQGSYQGQNQGGYGFPEWTTQDKLNLGTALATQTGIEYPTAMTYQAPEVELAKQEWLAGNQALTGQGAKNLDIIARSTAPSNVKQASAASLQGDIAERVVNNIAGVQARNVGTENQERGMNYQGRTAAGQNRQNILNQYMDKVGATENNYRGEMNAKRALTTQMANTGIKNAADIYNLQTEQYRIDPRTGMQIFKGGKPLKPEASEADDIAYIQSLQKAGIKDDQIELLLKKRLSKFGGAIFRHGGMVYGNSTYPFYND